jgi:ribosomal protein S18 acetylase RimI-like enzyme
LSSGDSIEVRRLAPGDEELVVALGEDRALTAAAAAELLGDPGVRYFVAFVGGEPAGYALAYVLRRRRLPERSVFLYDIEVGDAFRRRGIGRRLMNALAELAQDEAAEEGFVITSRSNEAGRALYRAAGGQDENESGDDVVVEFRYDG